MITAQLSGSPIYQSPQRWLRPSLEERNRRLAALAHPAREGDTCWFVISCPDSMERTEWRDLLAAKTVYVLSTDLAECSRRIRADRRRIGQADRMVQACERWFRQYDPSPHDVRVPAKEPAGVGGSNLWSSPG